MDSYSDSLRQIEVTLQRVKPVNLTRILFDFITATRHSTIISLGVQLLELYDVFWTFNVDKLRVVRDAFIHCLHYLPVVVKGLYQIGRRFIRNKFSRTNTHSESETVPKDVHVSTSVDDLLNAPLVNQGAADYREIPTDMTSLLQTYLPGFSWTKSLAVLCTLVVTLGSVIGGGAFMSVTTIGHKLSKFISTTGQACKNSSFMFDGIKSLYRTVLTGVSSVFGVSFDGPHSQKMNLIKRISDKIDEMRNFHDMCRTDMSSVMTKPHLFRNIEKDVAEITDLYKEIASIDGNLSNLRPLFDHLREVYTELRDYHSNLRQAITGKQLPATLWLYGESGVGKSELAKLLVRKLGEKEGRLLTSYVRNPVDKHWNSYIGQDVVIYDDFNASKDNLDHAELVAIYSGAAYSLPMASIAEKGTPFSSRYLIICSNFSHVTQSTGTSGLNDPTILFRRRDRLVRMHDPDMMSIRLRTGSCPTSAHYKSDWSHCNFHYVGLDLDPNGKALIIDATGPDFIAQDMFDCQLDRQAKFRHDITEQLNMFREGAKPKPSLSCRPPGLMVLNGTKIDPVVPKPKERLQRRRREQYDFEDDTYHEAFEEDAEFDETRDDFDFEQSARNMIRLRAEMHNQSNDDAILMNVVERTSFSLLYGESGTGKTTILQQMANILNTTVCHKEIIKSKNVIIDEIGYTPEFFEEVRKFIWDEYFNPTCERIILSGNEQTFDKYFTDEQQKTAFYRRCGGGYHFVFAKKYPLIPYSPLYTWNDVEKYGHSKVVRILTLQKGDFSHPVQDVVSQLSQPLPDPKVHILHRALIDMPLTDFTHWICMKQDTVTFFNQVSKPSMSSFINTLVNNGITLKKGSYTELMRLATAIFGRMLNVNIAKREDIESAFLYLNNSNDVAGIDATIIVEFNDACYGAVTSTTEPTLIVRRALCSHVETPEGISEVKVGCETLLTAPGVTRTIQKFDHDLNKNFEVLNASIAANLTECQERCRDAEADILMTIPQFFPLTQFVDTLCLFFKIGIASYAVYGVVRKATHKMKMTRYYRGELTDEVYHSEDDDDDDDEDCSYSQVEHDRRAAAYRQKQLDHAKDIANKQPKSSRTATKNVSESDSDQFNTMEKQDLPHESKPRKMRIGDMYGSESSVRMQDRELEHEVDFHGVTNPLSNFYPCDFQLDVFRYKSVEQAYQHQKSLYCQEQDISVHIMAETDPYVIKRISKLIVVKEGWLEKRLSVMRMLLKLKFSQPMLLQHLKRTGKQELIHDVKDPFWGSPGLNHMGLLLMEIRDPVPNESDSPDYERKHFPSRRFKHPKKKLPPLEEEEEPHNEAMQDIQARQLTVLVAHNTVYMTDDVGTVLCRGLMIKDRLGVTNAHAYPDLTVGDKIRVRIGENYIAHIVSYNKKRDQCWFQIENRCRMFKDLTAHMLLDTDTKDLTDNQALLVTVSSDGVSYDTYIRVVTLGAMTIRKIASVDRDGIAYLGHLSGYSYDPLCTVYGDCGSALVLMNTRKVRKLVGFHTAANVLLGMGSVLYVSDIPLTNECSLSDIRILKHQAIKPVIEEDHKLFKVLGRCWDLKTDEPIKLYHPTESKYYRSPFAWDQLPCDVEPAVLSNFDSRKTPESRPLEDALDKWSHPQPDIDIKLFDHAVEEIADHIAATIKMRMVPVKVLTKTEAINRVTELTTSNPIYRKSSAGYPYSLMHGVSKKEIFFEQHTIQGVPLYKISSNSYGRMLNNNVDQLITEARNGNRTAVVFSGSLKDELIKKKKIYDCTATRSFAGSPLDYTIANRMYFHAAAAAIAECRHVLPPQVGIDPRSTEWHRLYYQLAKVSDSGFDADYSGWDATVPRYAMECLPRIYNRIYQRCDRNWKEEDDKIRENLHSVLHGPLITYYDTIVQCPGGQVSGQPNTAMDNCLVNMIYFYYIWCKLAMKHAPKKTSYEDFLQNVGVAVYGDDNVCTITQEVQPWFNFCTFKEEAEKLGLTLTSALKDGTETPIKKLIDMTFLKRSFVRHDKLIIGPLEKRSLSKMLSWTKINRSHKVDLELDRVEYDPETITAVINSALEEACLHGKPFYDQMSEHLMNVCQAHSFRVDFWPPWSAKYQSVVLHRGPLAD
nr:MAG: RNA-dependent RNA polymerase [Pot worm picorna-like virus]